jgi:YHS domain-containing protein
MKYITIISFALLFSCNQAAQKPQVITSPPASSEEKTINIDASKLAMAKDPVCGMSLKSSAGDTVTYNGKFYGFCSKDCKDEFLKNPSEYLK